MRVHRGLLYFEAFPHRENGRDGEADRAPLSGRSAKSRCVVVRLHYLRDGDLLGLLVRQVLITVDLLLDAVIVWGDTFSKVCAYRRREVRHLWAEI